MLPQAIATKHSVFFRTAISGNFKEAKERAIELPKAEVDTFTSFLQWMYTGEVVVMEPEEAAKDQRNENQNERLAKLYVLGDYLQCIGLRNATIDAIIQLQRTTGTIPGQAAISIAFTSTPENCTLQKLLTTYGLNTQDVGWLEKSKTDLPTAFLYALVHGRMLNKNEKTLLPAYSDRCKFHQHDEELPKGPSCRP